MGLRNGLHREYWKKYFNIGNSQSSRKLSQKRPYLLKGVVEEGFGVSALRVGWVGFLDG